MTSTDLSRVDESPDTEFYDQPRFVMHIDDECIKALKNYYRTMLPKGGVVLDLMSSWPSHLADGHGSDKGDGYFSRLSLVGMNRDELVANPGGHDFHVLDLNASPSLSM